MAWALVTLLWIPIALLPLSELTSTERVLGLMALASLQGILRSLIALNWQSWLRDLIPGLIMGNVLSKGMVFGSISAILFSLASSLFLDYWRTSIEYNVEIHGYSIMLLGGIATLRIISPLCLARIPELRMFRATEPRKSLFHGLGAPLKDPPYRRL